jgi:mono/diheme cytochrome c family protein
MTPRRKHRFFCRRFLSLTFVAVGIFGCGSDDHPGATKAVSPTSTSESQPRDELSATTPYQEVPLVDGEELYASYCAACHGVEGRGDGPVAGNLKTATPDLATLAQRSGNKFPASLVEQYIRNEAGPESHGTLAMPLWGPIFGQMSGLDQQSRDKLRVLIGSDATSPSLADLRVTNLVSHIESLQR